MFRTRKETGTRLEVRGELVNIKTGRLVMKNIIHAGRGTVQGEA